MTFGSILKKTLISACYGFTAIILLYSLLVICFMDGMGMEPRSVFLFFPLSLGFSLANGIVKSSGLKNGLKIATHFAIVTVSLVLCVYLPRSGILSPGTKLIVFTLYLIFYSVFAVIYLVRSSQKKKRDDGNTEYKKVY